MANFRQIGQAADAAGLAKLMGSDAQAPLVESAMHTNPDAAIPQFDPLIEEKEKLISQLRQPKKHTIELIRVNEK